MCSAMVMCLPHNEEVPGGTEIFGQSPLSMITVYSARTGYWGLHSTSKASVSVKVLAVSRDPSSRSSA